MVSTAPTTEQAIAANRFGLGLRADEQAPADARQWLLGQLDRYQAAPAEMATAKPSSEIAAEHAEDRLDIKDMDDAAKKSRAQGTA